MKNADHDPKKHAGLKKRVISGLVLAPLWVAVIMTGGWLFIALVVAAGLLSLYEFAKLVDGTKHQYLHMAFGTIYLSLCFGSYLFMRFAFDQGAWLALAAMLAVWASDTGAYFTGKTIGGPKMTPHLSPNKTWAGLGGAMFFCGLTLVIMQFAGDFLSAHINTSLGLDASALPHLFLAGLILGVVGQGGDLLISFYKRRANIKDTGCLIPGHGGLLDRIDSVLLVSPVFLGIALLCL